MTNRLFKPRHIAAAAALIVAFGLGAIGTRAQEATTPSAADAQAGMSDFLQKVEASKLHLEPLKRCLGEWEVEQKMYFAGPDTPSSEQVAREKSTMLGEYWILGEVESEMNGQPYQGRSIAGYDMVKGKYVMYWVDTMAPFGMFFEGTYDRNTRTFTYKCNMKDAFTGLDSVYTIIDRQREDGTFSWVMHQRNDLGDRKLMEATYKRIEQ